MIRPRTMLGEMAGSGPGNAAERDVSRAQAATSAQMGPSPLTTGGEPGWSCYLWALPVSYRFSAFVSLCLSGETSLFCKPNRGLASGLARLRRGFLVLAFLLSAGLSVHAVEPNEQLKDPVLEARARAISTGLRCLVCQNETIDESNASLARDIRMLLRERLMAGDTDAQAVKTIVDRYGEFVLLNPPVRPATYVLWFGPVCILMAGLVGGVVWLRRRPATIDATSPLTADERRRLDTVMREADR